MTIAEITKLCRSYADAIAAMEEVTGEIQEERRKIVRQRTRRLMERVARVSAARDALLQAVGSSPELFEKPRTRALEGIKVGYRKKPGRIEVADEARSIERVRKSLPELEEVLVVVKEALDRNALKGLSVKQLAAIGARLTEDDDEVIVKAAGTDVDKLVEALLADVGEDASAAAAEAS